MKCKHTSAIWSRWTDGAWVHVARLSGPPIGGLSAARFFEGRLVCDKCGHWFSYGPSNDTAEVQIEIAAVEFALMAVENPRRWKREHSPGSDAGAGWWVHQMDLVESDKVTCWPGAQAGYLARCIVTHEDEP